MAGEMDWKDAATHRKPAWPLMGYAPGEYTGLCIICNQHFYGLAKGAFHCLPCAVDAANQRAKSVAEELRVARSEKETLRAAIRIVSTLPLSKEDERP